MHSIRIKFFYFLVLILCCGQLVGLRAEEAVTAEPENSTDTSRLVFGNINWLSKLWNWIEGVLSERKEGKIEFDESEDSSAAFRKISHYPIEGETSGVCLADGLTNHLCVIVYNSDLMMFDLSNPKSPVRKGTVPLGGLSMNVCAKAGYAYISSWNGGVQIVDFRQPESPKKVSQLLANEAQIYQTAIAPGDRLYVAAGNGGMVVADISNPEKPTVIGEFVKCEDVRSVAVYGDKVCIVDYLQGVKILDVSDLKHIKPVGESTEEDCFGGGFVVIDSAENRACVLADEPKITFFEITGQSNIKKVGALNLPGEVYVANWDYPMVYFGETGYGIKGYDLSNVPGEDESGMELFKTDGDVFDIAQSGDYFFVAERTEGLLVLKRLRQ